MGPKKRKDPLAGDEDAAVGSNPDVVATAAGEGQAQPAASPAHRSSDSEADQQQSPRDNDRQNDDSFGGTPGAEDQSAQGEVPPVKRTQNKQVDDDHDDLSVEELELEVQMLTRQNQIDSLRKTILKKKRQGHEATPQPSTAHFRPAHGHEDRTPTPAAPTFRESALPESEHVLRERQNERLRRAGLLPPRASEAHQPRNTTPLQPMRAQSVPHTKILSGIDRKIFEIMNATDSPDSAVIGDKSELAKLGIKVSSPEKWKGERSLQALTDWVQSVAHYFSLYTPMTERLKIQLIGGYLVGDPLDWYWRHVAPISQQWTAADVIVALRRQFLVDELSRQAADKFENADQGAKDVHAFQAYLLKLADQMAEYPSPVALNRRLLKGMKGSISAAIVANRGIDAELSGWDDIVQAAMDQERAHRYSGSLNKTVAPRTEERKDHRPNQSAQPIRPNMGSNFNRFQKPMTMARPVAPTTRPAMPNPMRNTAPPATRPTGPKPTDQCRSCGAFGHWSNDCPKRLRTNMLNHEDGDEVPEEFVEDYDQEPNVYIYEEDESPSDHSPQQEDEWHDADDEVENNNSSDHSKEDTNDDETPLMCNSASYKADIIRESNVSAAKTPSGDNSKVSQHRPPLVDPIVAKIKINGHDAKALFDSGSTADLISASFVDAHRLQSFKLEHPSPLQLAITGSRGKINRACFAKVTHGSCNDKMRYFDILNIDRYDVILGTSYQKDFGVLLDVSANDVVYKSSPSQLIFAPKNDKNSTMNPKENLKKPLKTQLSALGVSHSKFENINKK
ncbi:unnamed protein product [Tilletia controversa]|uniref:CCHC-type domain-containing protein n=2 Tax=Tilletia TaxID=13289 RepID=A0A177UTS0_9BASI|nr:hypothetical protein A4X03_0g5488 [Tilletia caries]CAD6900022.1 unnamed protein product [Tilletia laevis]CAD6912856.1 unnamed protein product [Tilletia controversa]CAD6886231.1 unnamed protein product [Tilletia caries]CAD6899881.1 unnamed protein product [Tilletia caries]